MRSLLAAGAVSALVLATSVQAQDAAAYDANTVLARVNGTEITLGHLIVLRDSLPQEYQTLPDEMLMPGLLEQLVDQTLLADARAASGAPDPLFVRLRLDNERRGMLAGEAVQEEFADPLDEAAVQAAYDAQVAAFVAQPEFNASHILVADEAAANALKAEIEGGGDFAALATEHSTDPGSGANGGLLGWFGMGQMVPEFEAAVAAMEVGGLAGPVQSQFGWHLIRLNEKRDSTPPTIDAVRPQLESQLRQEALQARLAELRAAGSVEMVEAAVPPAAIRESDLVTD